MSLPNIRELSRRAQRIFINLLHAIEFGNPPLDEEGDDERIVIIQPLLGEEAERIINCGRTFTELQHALKISSRTSAKYLKICEKNDLVTGYRCGRVVKYYLTGRGRQFLHKLVNYGGEGCTFLLSPLALLALTYPNSIFYRGPLIRLKIGRRNEILLESHHKVNLEPLPEGRVYTLFLKLIRGMGYEVFSRRELEAMNIEITWRLSMPKIRDSDLVKLEEVKRIRGIRRKPLHRIMQLIDWAILMSDNIDKYYRLIQNKECIEVERAQNKIIIFILDERGNITHVIA